MTPFEVWTFFFGGIEPGEFWRISRDEAHCQQADEAIDLALSGCGPLTCVTDFPPTMDQVDTLTAFLAGCVTGLPRNAVDPRHAWHWSNENP